MRAHSILLAAFALSGAASAATADGNFGITGAGGVPCSTITADVAARGDAASAEIASWLMGYTTASNRSVDDTYQLMGAGGIDAYWAAVQADCAANPDKIFEKAAFDVLNAGYAQRLTAKP